MIIQSKLTLTYSRPPVKFSQAMAWTLVNRACMSSALRLHEYAGSQVVTLYIKNKLSIAISINIIHSMLHCHAMLAWATALAVTVSLHKPQNTRCHQRRSRRRAEKKCVPNHKVNVQNNNFQALMLNCKLQFLLPISKKLI